MEEQMPLRLAFIIVGTINEHWWNGSQPIGDREPWWNPEECGPCSALRDIPRDIAEEAVRRYDNHVGDKVGSFYWDKERDRFRDGVDFSEPADISGLIAAHDAEGQSDSTMMRS